MGLRLLANKLALLALCACLGVTQAHGAQLLLEQQDIIELPATLPSLIAPVDGPTDPHHWLKQTFHPHLYDVAIQPSLSGSWHKLTLSSQQDLSKVLVIDTHILRHLRLYLFNGEQLIKTQHLGINDEGFRPWLTQQKHYLGLHFPFEISAKQPLTLLIYKQNNGPGILPMTLYSAEAFAERQHGQTIFWGGIICVLIALAIYNVLVYAMFPNRSYLWYLVFHCTCFFYFGALNGYGYWLWSFDLQILLAQHIMVMNFILIILIINFARVFLESRQHAPWHHKYVTPLTIISALGAFTSIIVPEYHMIAPFTLVQLVGSVFGISMGITALKNGFKPALYFLCAWAFTIVGGAVGMSAVLNKIPVNIYTLHGFLSGTLIELFLLSMALASRVKYMEQLLLTQSYYYPETQIGNFSYLRHKLPQYLPNLYQQHHQLVLIICDIKGFREVVSLYGPQALTHCYRQHTEKLNYFLAHQAWAVPLPFPDGKSVYLVALPGEQMLMMVDAQQAKNGIHSLIGQIKAQGEMPSQYDEVRLSLKLDFGYVFMVQAQSFQEQYRQAQIALISAQEKQQSALEYKPVLDLAISDRASLLHDLQLTIEKKALNIYLQPQFSFDGKKILGGEILLRWLHPEKGQISPGVFIPLAENSGLIYSITHLVIEKVCQWLAHLKKNHPEFYHNFCVSINLSAMDFSEPQLISHLQSSLFFHGIESKHIILEITESAVMNDPNQFLQTLKKLKTLGFSISIDDFGTGYSSLRYLQTMSAQEIKIDMAFVRDIHNNPMNQQIVKTIVQLAKASGAHTVAEGIESTDEAYWLSQQNIHQGQGYLWSAPLSLEEFEANYLTGQSNPQN